MHLVSDDLVVFGVQVLMAAYGPRPGFDGCIRPLLQDFDFPFLFLRFI